MPTPPPELLALLADRAERVRRTLRAACASVSCWEREQDRLRTLVNVGVLEPEEKPFPAEEVYPLDTFPATRALLYHGRPYVDPPDVASTAVLAHLGLGSQAAVAVVVDGRVWGELWAATEAGGRTLEADDVLALTRGAEALGRLLAEHVSE
jgi:GAF domain-containing protein